MVRLLLNLVHSLMSDAYTNILMELDFSLKLPGFSLSVLGYLGGEDYLR